MACTGQDCNGGGVAECQEKLNRNIGSLKAPRRASTGVEPAVSAMRPPPSSMAFPAISLGSPSSAPSPFQGQQEVQSVTFQCPGVLILK